MESQRNPEGAAGPEARTATDRLLFLVAACAVLVATLVAARLVLSTRTGTVDSYYYFARAADLNDATPLAKTTINWAEGVDRKFFPGYPLLLHWLSFGSAPERAWRSLAVLLVLVDSVLLGLAMRRLGLGFGAACATVALFATNFVPLNWMTMPMAEGTALLWLCLAALALPKKEDPLAALHLRFLLACFLGGMAILARAEAAYPAAMLGLVGVARLRGRSGWLLAAAGGAVLGALPFAYWVGSLPPAVEGSRLHYVNEFVKNFSWRDSEDGQRGGLLDNFLRSWWHPIFNWGRVPFTSVAALPEWLRGDLPPLRGLFMGIFVLSMALGIAGFGGPRARWFSLAYVGFVVFRSFWYYPYDRFLVSGLPMGFAAMALLGESFSRRGRGPALVAAIVFAVWVGRGAENFLRYHTYHRLPENGAHSYRDDRELDRLQYQMQYTSFPLEGADVAVLAGRRIARTFETTTTGAATPAALRKEKIAIEFPWPQICYALRPRPIVMGFPLENFWGPAAYRRFETVPEGPGGVPAREPRTAIEFLRDEKVRYVVTPLPLSVDLNYGDADKQFGTWPQQKGLDAQDLRYVKEIDNIRERYDDKKRYDWPLVIRVLELRFPPK